jgi:hypothetical protein
METGRRRKLTETGATVILKTSQRKQHDKEDNKKEHAGKHALFKMINYE